MFLVNYSRRQKRVDAVKPDVKGKVHEKKLMLTVWWSVMELSTGSFLKMV